jgi:hypothetical protein
MPSRSIIVRTWSAAAAAILKINSLGNQVASADSRLISKQLMYLSGLVGLLMISAGDPQVLKR